MDYEELMHLAIIEASRSGDDVPVGALLVTSGGQVIAAAHNRKELKHDPTAHAEIEAMRDAAAKLGSWNLSGLTMVVTLEPCQMCFWAIREARLPKVIFGAASKVCPPPQSYSFFDLAFSHGIEVIPGVLENRCSAQLSEYFLLVRGGH